MIKKVLVPIADGSEEIEVVCIIDVLRRAGALVTVASVNQLQITASRGVRLLADCLIDDCMEDLWDLIVLPGGMPGAEHLRDSRKLKILLERQIKSNNLYGAICASPAVVLQVNGFLGPKRATCHANFRQYLENQEAISENVVVDGNCITSRGPGTALQFALKLVEMLFDKQKANEVAVPMHINP